MNESTHNLVPAPLDTLHAELRSLIASSRQRLPAEVNEDWKEYITAMGQDDVLHAWLCCAWLRQRVGSGQRKLRSLPPVPDDGTLPWVKQPYWQKERNHQALMQIASAHRQALLWSGEDDPYLRILRTGLNSCFFC